MRISAIILPITMVWAAVGLGTAAFADSQENPADLKNGRGIYEETCVFCHGRRGKGEIPGVSDLTKKSGPLSKSDVELIANVMKGFESPGTMMAMPAKGGNPDLTESDIHDVVAYLRQAFQKR